jgi:hypothetical protein
LTNFIFNFNFNFNKYKVISIAAISFLTLSFMTLGWMDTQNHSSFARCPNGSHKSPSGDCEVVVKSSSKQPRCPNGFHRSPGGFCESVTGSTQGDSITSSSKISNNNPNFSEQPPAASNNKPPINSINTSNVDVNTTATNALPLSNLSTGQCDQLLWNHVYHPERLQIVDKCKTVSGVIESKKPEADGDFHMRLKLDPQFSNLINVANVNGQLGDMVVEPVCQKGITQLDAIPACLNFHQDIVIPTVSSHVNVTGSYVLDKEHGSWAEIHPVTSIVKIP